jgi:hypothetical protein
MRASSKCHHAGFPVAAIRVKKLAAKLVWRGPASLMAKLKVAADLFE